MLYLDSWNIDPVTLWFAERVGANMTFNSTSNTAGLFWCWEREKQNYMIVNTHTALLESNCGETTSLLFASYWIRYYLLLLHSAPRSSQLVQNFLLQCSKSRKRPENNLNIRTKFVVRVAFGCLYQSISTQLILQPMTPTFKNFRGNLRKVTIYLIVVGIILAVIRQGSLWVLIFATFGTVSQIAKISSQMKISSTKIYSNAEFSSIKSAFILTCL